MARSLTEPECQAFLAEPRIGVLSVVSDDERPPLTIPIWYSYDPGGEIAILTGTQGRAVRKTRLIQRAGVLSLLVQQDQWPYKYVTAEGTVVRADRPPTADQMLAIVRRYLPEEQAQAFVQAEVANSSDTLILFAIRPDRWLSTDYSEDAAASTPS